MPEYKSLLSQLVHIKCIINYDTDTSSKLRQLNFYLFSVVLSLSLLIKVIMFTKRHKNG